jgi:hypothetical protein
MEQLDGPADAFGHRHRPSLEAAGGPTRGSERLRLRAGGSAPPPRGRRAAPAEP